MVSTLNSNAMQLSFIENRAKSFGCAINLIYCSLFLGDEIKSYHSFSTYSDGYFGGRNINITVEQDCFSLPEDVADEQVLNEISTTFSNNETSFGGGLALRDTSVLFSGRNITFTGNRANRGGGMYLKRAFMITFTKFLNFTGNMANEAGGAIVAFNATIKLGEAMDTNHYFNENSAELYGGAIYCDGPGLLAIQGNTNFVKNYAKLNGGAIVKIDSLFFITCKSLFLSNYAQVGGAIDFRETGAMFYGTSLEFRNNSADSKNGTCYRNGRTCFGGAIMSNQSQIKSYTEDLNFVENSAVSLGGAISTMFGSELTLAPVTFLRNDAERGGAIYAEKIQGVLLFNITAIENSGSALSIRECPTIIRGTSIFDGNYGEKGGAIYAANSYISLLFYVQFISNRARIGGAIFAFNRVKFRCSGLIVFENNTADTNGGAIYAVDADISFNATAQFEGNSAQNGGAMFFESETKLTIETYTYFNASYNHATEYGGVIYHEDGGITTRQCEYDKLKKDMEKDIFLLLPYCFISMKGISVANHSSHIPIYIKSYYNTAGTTYMEGLWSSVCNIQCF